MNKLPNLTFKGLMFSDCENVFKIAFCCAHQKAHTEEKKIQQWKENKQKVSMMSKNTIRTRLSQTEVFLCERETKTRALKPGCTKWAENQRQTLRKQSFFRVVKEKGVFLSVLLQLEVRTAASFFFELILSGLVGKWQKSMLSRRPTCQRCWDLKGKN